MYKTDTMILVACIGPSFSVVVLLLYDNSWFCKAVRMTPALYKNSCYPLFQMWFTSRCSLSPETASHRCPRQTPLQTQNDGSSWVTLWRKQSWIISYTWRIFSNTLQFLPALLVTSYTMMYMKFHAFFVIICICVWTEYIQTVCGLFCHITSVTQV